MEGVALSQMDTNAEASFLNSQASSANIGPTRELEPPQTFVSSLTTDLPDTEFAKSYVSLNTNKVSSVFKRRFLPVKLNNVKFNQFRLA